MANIRAGRFLFFIILITGMVLAAYFCFVRIFQEKFFANYPIASCFSGVFMLAILYIITRSIPSFEDRADNFLYYKGKKSSMMHLKSVTIDKLTGLYEFSYFWFRLEEEIANSKSSKVPVSLLIMDIDHFKSYNTKFGPPAGDEALVRTGEVIRHFTGKAQAAARYGAEGFAIIMPGTRKDGALIIAEEIRACLREMKLTSDKRITVSIGAGSFDGSDMTFKKEYLVKSANDALCRARKNGGNRAE